MDQDKLNAAWAALRGWQEPFGPFSDLECTEHDCYREALVEDGRRTALCRLHLHEWAPRIGERIGGDVLTREDVAARGLVIDARDLTPAQRAWTPGEQGEQDPQGLPAYMREWPHADRVEVWDAVMMFENRWQAPWTWRSVALAARAYPDRRVRLVHNKVQVPGRAGEGPA